MHHFLYIFWSLTQNKMQDEDFEDWSFEHSDILSAIPESLLREARSMKSCLIGNFKSTNLTEISNTLNRLLMLDLELKEIFTCKVINYFRSMNWLCSNSNRLIEVFSTISIFLFVLISDSLPVRMCRNGLLYFIRGGVVTNLFSECVRFACSATKSFLLNPNSNDLDCIFKNSKSTLQQNLLLVLLSYSLPNSFCLSQIVFLLSEVITDKIKNTFSNLTIPDIEQLQSSLNSFFSRIQRINIFNKWSIQYQIGDLDGASDWSTIDFKNS